MKNSLKERIEKEFLPFVIKPGRYVGNELNVIKKEHSGKIKVALGFPDLYEIGMSHLGLSILYHIINSRKDSLAERFFAVDIDAEKVLREQKIPLFSLESRTPLKDFDILGFPLTHELNYINLLNILDLSGIPMFSQERDENHPLIIAGGPSASNPEPMAEFVDVFVIGDGEEIINEILDKYKELKSNNSKREDIFLELSKIPGVYVPSLYKAEYDDKGQLKGLTPKYEDIPRLIHKRIVQSLKEEYYPRAPLVPLIEVTHDRLDLEIMRGCAWKCKFCYACQLYAPLRSRSIGEILFQAEQGITSSGWDEVSLLSLSTTDYPQLEELVVSLNNLFQQKKVSIALPSMRADSFTKKLAQQILKTKKTGLTFAPEAGTERLRKIINKDIDEEKLLKSVEIAYSSGWNLIKLYFMIGLPGETEEDLKGVVNIIQKVIKTGKRIGPNKNLNVTISPFIPKPHTPFQWERQASVGEIKEKTGFLKSNLRVRNLNLKIRNPQVPHLEGILGRGDRKLSKAILFAWQSGAKFDAWSEHFNFEIWERSFEQAGINVETYLAGKKREEPLPWSHISLETDKELIQRQIKKSTVVEKESEQEKENSFASYEEAEGYGRKRKRKIVSSQLRVARSRVRIKWAKKEEVRFSSHLDIVRMFERAIRRSNIPIAYSEGFHPHPKISFGPPLPLGFISDTEYLDLQLFEPYFPTIFFNLDRALHPGFKLLESKPILGKASSLSSSINLAVYEVFLDQPMEAIRSRVEELLGRNSLLVTKKSKGKEKEVEARYFIRNLECLTSDNKIKLELSLMLGARGYIRPEEVLHFGLGIDEKQIAGLLIKRTGLLIQKDDRILSPLEMV